MWASAGTPTQTTYDTASGPVTIPSANLTLVDPLSPTPGATVESGNWALQGGAAAQVLDGSGNLTQLNTRYLVYAKGNRLHRLDLLKGSGTPAPTLLSSVTTQQLCAPSSLFSDMLGADAPNPDRTVLVYRAPGPDAACDTADDTYIGIRLNMTGTDAPLVTTATPITFINGNAGELTGFVVRTGNQIQRVDASFANPTLLFTVSGGTFARVGRLTNAAKDIFVYRDGSDVRVYDLKNGTGPTTLFSLAAGETALGGAPDSSGMYLVVNTSSSGRVVRVTDALAVTTLATETAGPPNIWGTTPTRVIFAAAGNLRSVPKAGGSVTTLASISQPAFLAGAFPSGENVYYSSAGVPTSTSSGKLLGIVQSDGSNPQQIADAYAIGVHLSNPLPVIRNDTGWYAILVAHALPPGVSSFSGASLRAYEGPTRNVLVNYGSLPAGGFITVSNSNTGALWRQPDLFVANALVGTSLATDLFFYRSDAAGVTRVTSFVP